MIADPHRDAPLDVEQRVVAMMHRPTLGMAVGDVAGVVVWGDREGLRYRPLVNDPWR